MVRRQQDFNAFFLGFGQNGFSFVFFFGVKQGFADFVTLYFQERVRHTAADDEDIYFIHQIVKQHDFVGHFGAADYGRKRTGRVFKRFAQKFHLFLYEVTRAGR